MSYINRHIHSIFPRLLRVLVPRQEIVYLTGIFACNNSLMACRVPVPVTGGGVSIAPNQQNP